MGTKIANIEVKVKENRSIKGVVSKDKEDRERESGK